VGVGLLYTAQVSMENNQMNAEWSGGEFIAGDGSHGGGENGAAAVD